MFGHTIRLLFFLSFSFSYEILPTGNFEKEKNALHFPLFLLLTCGFDVDLESAKVKGKIIPDVSEEK